MADENDLLKRAQAYDREALAELYDKYAPLIYAYLYRRVSDVQVAEDLTSDVFVRMLRAIRTEWFWHTSFRAWLYRIAHNLAVDHFRRSGSSKEVRLGEYLSDGLNDPEDVLERKLERERLHAAIARLTPEQQQVLSLRFGERLTAREVAEIMGKSVGAVEALQHRALVALRRILKD